MKTVSRCGLDWVESKLWFKGNRIAVTLHYRFSYLFRLSRSFYGVCHLYEHLFRCISIDDVYVLVWKDGRFERHDFYTFCTFFRTHLLMILLTLEQRPRNRLGTEGQCSQAYSVSASLPMLYKNPSLPPSCNVISP